MRSGLAAVISLVIVGATLTPAARAQDGPLLFPAKPISGPSPFEPDCSGGLGHAHGTEVEPHVTIDPSDPTRVVAIWIQDRFPEHGGGQSNVLAASHDGGTSWTKVRAPGISRCDGGPWQRATDPWLSAGPGGELYMSSLSMDGQLSITWARNALTVNRSIDGGMTWSEPSVVIDDPAIILNDKEAITADPTRPGTVYVVWARFFGVIAVLYLSTSHDGGVTWQPPAPMVVLDQPFGQGNEILVTPDGTLVNVFATSGGVYAIRSTDGGTTWSPRAFIGPLRGTRVRSPAGTGVRSAEFIPNADVGVDGSIWVTWQDSHPFGSEITVSRSTDAGATWSQPRAAAAVDGYAFLPAIAVDDDGTAGVVFYDFRNDHDDDLRSTTDVWFAWSTDGESWSERHLAGPFDLERAPNASGLFLGDYIGLEAAGSTFHAIFPMAPATGEAPITDVYHARVVFP